MSCLCIISEVVSVSYQYCVDGCDKTKFIFLNRWPPLRFFVLLISAPRLGVYYFFVIESVCLSVHLSVCHAAPSNWFFFFVFRRNRAIFWPSSLHVALYKTLFFDFWFRPPNAQNWLPKVACDNATLTRRHPCSRSRHGSSAWGKSAIHWTSGLTLVAIAMKFDLGAEIWTPTGLS